MPAREDNVRRLTGSFLVMIFLVFILGNNGQASAISKTDDSIITVSASTATLVEPVCRVSHDFNPDFGFSLKLSTPALLFPSVFVDISAAKILTSRAFFISPSERNVFYVLASIHAP